MLRDLISLDDNSRRLANEELQRRHIIPRIVQIVSIFNQSAKWFWNVDRDCGPIVIIMDNLHENIHPIADGRWILTDAEGFRFELSNAADLDDKSRSLWQESIVWQYGSRGLFFLILMIRNVSLILILLYEMYSVNGTGVAMAIVNKQVIQHRQHIRIRIQEGIQVKVSISHVKGSDVDSREIPVYLKILVLLDCGFLRIFVFP